ncbi:MAG: hypothetical protein V2B15_14360 [Bacteroidota bacterium]
MDKFFMNCSRQEILKRVGSVQQIAGTQRYLVEEGKGKGISMLRMRNGTQKWQFVLLPLSSLWTVHLQFPILLVYKKTGKFLLFGGSPGSCVA